MVPAVNPARTAKTDPFSPLSADERRRELDAFVAHLHARHGVPNRARRELPNREAFLREISTRPVRWTGPLDRESFHRMLQRPSDRELDPRIAWLLTAAKANHGERYAGDSELAPKRGNSDLQAGDPTDFLTLEQLYRSRMLLEACRVFGVEFDVDDRRSRAGALIELFARVPRMARKPLRLGSAVVGAAVFQLLLEQIVLFHEQPLVAERLGLLLREILQDEIGHIVYCRATMGPVALRSARRLLPMLVRAISRNGPEIARLAGGPQELRDRVMTFELPARALAAEHGWQPT